MSDGMEKAARSLTDYFDRISASPLALAYHLASLPDPIRERIFEFAIAFIQEVANYDAYSPMMQGYKEIAKRIDRVIGR